MKRLLTGAMLLCTFAACKRQTYEKPISENAGAAQTGAAAEGSDFTDYPRVEDGILSFRDSAHVASYMDFLNASISTADAEADVEPPVFQSDPDDVLLSIEKRIGFTSLRNTTEANFMAMNERGWEKLEMIPERHFINDLATKSVLSPRGDVKVGDKITHYVNKDFAATFSALDKELLAKLQELGPRATLQEILPLQQLSRNGDLKIHPLSVTNALVWSQAKTTGYPFTINGPVATTPDPCNDPKRTRLDGIQLSVVGQYGITLCQAYYEISWGDGTTSYHTSSGGVNGADLSNVYHNYPSQGNFTITIKARAIYPVSTGATWDEQKPITIAVPNGCNMNVSRTSSTYWHYTTDGTNKAWSGKNWVEQYTNFFNTPKHCTGAKTVAYKRDNGTWKEYKADRVVAQYWITKYASNCNNNWNGSGASWPHNSKTAETSHTNNGHIGWFKIVSNHRIYIGSNAYSFDLETKVCP